MGTRIKTRDGLGPHLDTPPPMNSLWCFVHIVLLPLSRAVSHPGTEHVSPLCDLQYCLLCSRGASHPAALHVVYAPCAEQNGSSAFGARPLPHPSIRHLGPPLWKEQSLVDPRASLRHSRTEQPARFFEARFIFPTGRLKRGRVYTRPRHAAPFPRPGFFPRRMPALFFLDVKADLVRTPLALPGHGRDPLSQSGPPFAIGTPHPHRQPLRRGSVSTDEWPDR